MLHLYLMVGNARRVPMLRAQPTFLLRADHCYAAVGRYANSIQLTCTPHLRFASAYVAKYIGYHYTRPFRLIY